jgi:hypothetical protein
MGPATLTETRAYVPGSLALKGQTARYPMLYPQISSLMRRRQ